MSGNYPEALDNLLKANKLTPGEAKVRNNLAMAYFFQKRANKAINILQEIIEKDPSYSDARNNLASIYFRQRKLTKALDQYNIVLEDLVYRHQYRTHHAIGMIEEEFKNINKAIAHYKSAVKINPEYCPSFFRLGMIYLQGEDYSNALTSFKKGSQGTCHQHPSPLYYQAVVWEKLDDLNQASKVYRDVISIHPKSKEAKKSQVRLTKLMEKDPVLAIPRNLPKDAYDKIKSLKF